MVFSSYEFLFVFLPLVWLAYWAVAPRSAALGRWVLIAASLVFYGWWNWRYLPLLIVLALFTYVTGQWLRQGEARKPWALAGGIAVLLGALGYFKYTDFFIETANVTLGTEWKLLHIVLPLAISFFTFQKIGYLVDAYHKQAKDYTLGEFFCFVSFFPQLIAGPIVYHRELIPQLRDAARLKLNAVNIRMGLFLLSIGLMKKVLLADGFSPWVAEGMAGAANANFTTGWLTALAYTLQLYFDFSAYSDMALGIALLFNITLPFNFDSPYKSANIQEFWRRWHITLGRFLRDYLYLPLGGSRKGLARTCINLGIVFVLAGIWHGAGWTFLLWGAIHAAALITHRLFAAMGLRLLRLAGQGLTFFVVVLAWVVFRAENLDAAFALWHAMLLTAPDMAQFTTWLSQGERLAQWARLFLLGMGLALVWLAPNSLQLVRHVEAKPRFAWLAGLGAGLAVLSISSVSEFLYYRF